MNGAETKGVNQHMENNINTSGFNDTTNKNNN
jgi:hypothetical protein